MRYLIEALHHPKDYKWWELRPWQKHSEVLAVASFVYLSIGLSLMRPVSPARQESLGILFDLLPPVFWGCVWIAVALLALASTRWPPASKTWGYTAMTGVAVLWGMGYLVGVVFDGAPKFGLVGALVYGLLGYMWYAIAGLRNPDDLIALSPLDGTDVGSET